MDRTSAIQTLNELLKTGRETRSSIARKLKIHPSQVSRIASGKFVRLDGRALKVCKFAQSAIGAEVHRNQTPANQLSRIQSLLIELLEERPDVADALELLMESLISPRPGCAQLVRIPLSSSSDTSSVEEP